MEKTVEFLNREKKKLFGIVHIPNNYGRDERCGIIFMNAGIEDRVGPHRINIKIARELCKKGYLILRLDNFGIGFSEGELKIGTNSENFFLVENGLFVNDTIDAIDYFKKEFVLTKIIIMGFCGGAVTALLSASFDKRINNLILLEPPVYLDSNTSNTQINPLEAKKALRGKFFKLFLPKSWIKVITLQMDLNKLFRYFLICIQDSFIDSNNKRTLGKPINENFVNAYLAYISSQRKILIIFGDDTNTSNEFKYRFYDKYHNIKTRDTTKLIRIKNANHEFHSLSSQQLLINAILNWVDVNN